MKYIVRILVSAFAFISVAACYNNEIENPDNPQNPEQSGLSITATMAKTRVNYGNETDAQLLPVWEPDDILFGFYVDGDGDIQNFILKVTRISANDSGSSYATLGFVTGKANDLAKQAVGTKVYLIYTGKNGVSSITESDKFTSDGFSVDLTSQDLDRIPVCMSATATISGTDDAKTLSFGFTYDCAVLEVETLAGFDEEGFEAGSLSGIEVSGISFMGKYSYDKGNITFAAVADDTSYSQSLDGWSVSADSELTCSGETKKILISAIPTSSDDITISYKRNDSNICSETFSNRTLAKGNCYVIRHNYVAKTSDNHYFETVAEAFDYVSEHPDFNTVTLVRKHIDGLGEHPEPDEDGDASLMVEIDYDVTLDLNGCTLSLIDAEVEGDDTSECFYVYAYVEDETGEGHLTIKDSRSGGAIESESASHIILNDGNVTIENGKIKHISEEDGWCAVKNWGKLNVMDGELYSCLWNAITNDGGELTIDGGKVYSSSGYAVDNTGDLSVNGGEVYTNSSGAAIFSNCSAPPRGAIVTIGGTENNVDGPCIHNDSYEFPSIYIIGPSSGNEKVTFTMNQGLVYGSSGAFIFQGRVESSIKGGEIATGYINWSDRGKNKAFSAISLYDNVLSCEISGGKIITGKYGQSCIYSRASDVTLTLKWDGQNRSEPFLYSKCNTAGNCPPLQVVTGARCNINILGGLIYEGGSYVDPPSDVFLYNDTKVKNLSLSNFYSNKLFYTACIDKKDTYTFTNYSEGYTVNACDINIDGVITIDETELNFYHIEPPAESPSAPAGTSKYYFDSFDW